MKRIAIAVVSCAAMTWASACVSLGGLAAGPTDASTTDDAEAPDASHDASALDAEGTDAGNTADAAADAGEAGAAFQRVFVTSATMTGKLGGLAGADLICANAAKAAMLAGTYKAILSDPSGNARVRLAIHGPIRVVAVDGTSALVATNAADLWDGTLLAAIDRDEHGATVPQGAVWTGSAADGTLPGTAHCTYWSTAVSNDSGWAGNAAATNQDWIISVWGPQMYTSLSCDSMGRLYCLEQ